MDSFEENFLRVCEELEKLDETFVIAGAPPEYEGVWLPNNEVRLWQIPRTSAQILKAFALANKSKVILELGTSAGYSALWLASATRHFDGKVYTIEMAKPKIDMARGYFTKAGLTDSIEQLEGEIGNVLRTWTKEIDMVFLDADKPNYLSYIQQFEPFLKKGSVVIADNASDFGHLMKDYIAHVSEGGKYYSHLLPIDHGLLISVKL